MKGKIDLNILGININFDYYYIPEDDRVCLSAGRYPAGNLVDFEYLSEIEAEYHDEIRKAAMRDLDEQYRPKTVGIPGVTYLNKYVRGGKFDDICELGSWISSGGWMFWDDKPYHPGFIERQQFRTLTLNFPRLERAILNVKGKEAATP